MDALIVSVNELSAWVVSQLGLMAMAGSLLMGVSVLALRFDRTSASTRHCIWLLAIVVPVLLPIGSFLLPRWSIQAWANVELMKTEPTALAAGLHSNVNQAMGPEVSDNGSPGKTYSSAQADVGFSSVGVAGAAHVSSRTVPAASSGTEARTVIQAPRADLAERDQPLPVIIFM